MGNLFTKSSDDSQSDHTPDQPTRNQPDRSQPDWNQPDRNQPDRNQPDWNQPDWNQPDGPADRPWQGQGPLFRQGRPAQPGTWRARVSMTEGTINNRERFGEYLPAEPSEEELRNTYFNGKKMKGGSELCLKCHYFLNDAMFVHSHIYSHQVCCYSCAMAMWRRGEPCPICQCPILAVTLNYMST